LVQPAADSWLENIRTSECFCAYAATPECELDAGENNEGASWRVLPQASHKVATITTC
jgi:hypothetical protein